MYPNFKFRCISLNSSPSTGHSIRTLKQNIWMLNWTLLLRERPQQFSYWFTNYPYNIIFFWWTSLCRANFVTCVLSSLRIIELHNEYLIDPQLIISTQQKCGKGDWLLVVQLTTGGTTDYWWYNWLLVVQLITGGTTDYWWYNWLLVVQLITGGTTDYWWCNWLLVVQLTTGGTTDYWWYWWYNWPLVVKLITGGTTDYWWYNWLLVVLVVQLTTGGTTDHWWYNWI